MTAGHDLKRADQALPAIDALADILAAALRLVANASWSDPEDATHDCWFVTRADRKQLEAAIEAAMPGAIARLKEGQRGQLGGL